MVGQRGHYPHNVNTDEELLDPRKLYPDDSYCVCHLRGAGNDHLPMLAQMTGNVTVA